jgi:hypothetical protein
MFYSGSSIHKRSQDDVHFMTTLINHIKKRLDGEGCQELRHLRTTPNKCPGSSEFLFSINLRYIIQNAYK